MKTHKTIKSIKEAVEIVVSNQDALEMVFREFFCNGYAELRENYTTILPDEYETEAVRAAADGNHAIYGTAASWEEWYVVDYGLTFDQAKKAISKYKEEDKEDEEEEIRLYGKSWHCESEYQIVRLNPMSPMYIMEIVNMR